MPIPGSQFQSEQFAVKARTKRVNIPNVKGAIWRFGQLPSRMGTMRTYPRSRAAPGSGKIALARACRRENASDRGTFGKIIPIRSPFSSPPPGGPSECRIAWSPSAQNPPSSAAHPMSATGRPEADISGIEAIRNRSQRPLRSRNHWPARPGTNISQMH
jgi:hypothetical protein